MFLLDFCFLILLIFVLLVLRLLGFVVLEILFLFYVYIDRKMVFSKVRVIYSILVVYFVDKCKYYDGFFLVIVIWLKWVYIIVFFRI